jgi:hypothetical protein
MAYVSTAEGGYGAAASLIHHDPGHSSPVSIPDAELLFNGEFRRAGPDLVLTGHDGRHHLVPGYFSSEHPSALVAPNGARLSGDLIGLLAGSPTPAQYAQAQPTAPPEAIGKVEKAIGSVSVVRNGVTVALNVGDAVYKSDVLQTGSASVVGISFPDGTALNLVANTRMALNEYSYDANGTSNVALLSLVEGTFAFVAGKVAHTGDMKIVTPVATMGIRGTTGYVEEVATITANLGNVAYSFVVVDDYGTTNNGRYDLFDQNGNLLATVSQTGFLTLVTPQGNNLPPVVSTVPLTPSQAAFEQQIIGQVFETLNANGPVNPQSTPGSHGSSTPPDDIQNNQPLQQQLHDQGTTPFTVNVPINGSTGPTVPVVVTINPPPLAPTATAWAGGTLVEYYFFPDFGAHYYTSPTFVAPTSGIVGNPDAGGIFLLAVGATSITVTDFKTDGVFYPSTFNGFEIADLSGNPLISGVTIDAVTNMAGLTPSDISFDSDAVWVNFAGLGFTPGTIIKLDLTFDPPLDPSQFGAMPILNGAISPASNIATLTVADGTALALAGTIDNTGTIAVNASSSLTAIEIDGNVTLIGGGHIELSESNQNYIYGSNATLTNVDNTISGSGDIGNGTLIFHNEGVVEALGPYALIIDTGSIPFVNTGTLETDGSTLMIQSPVTGGGNAIIAGGTLEFFNASDNNVSFTGSNPGVLALDQSQSFTGHISGFSGPDQIDLGNIAFSSATTLDYVANGNDTGGTLIVSDGSHTADLAMIGDYSTSSFEASTDGHGGTMLADASSATTEQSGTSILTSGGGSAAGSQDVADGTLTFTASQSANSETASFTPEGSGYAGAFSLDPVSQSNGSTTIGWQFSLDNDQINLGPGQTITQSYDVNIVGAQGSAGNQTVSVSLGGTGNDNFVFQPGIGADTIVNFNPKVDTIELDHFANAQTVQQLQALVTSNAHGDAVIDLGHNDSITLPGMTAAQLQAVLQSAVHLH